MSIMTQTQMFRFRVSPLRSRGHGEPHDQKPLVAQFNVGKSSEWE